MEVKEIPDELNIKNAGTFRRIPIGKSWKDLNKIVETKGNYSGFIIFCDDEIYKLLE